MFGIEFTTTLAGHWNVDTNTTFHSKHCPLPSPCTTYLPALFALSLSLLFVPFVPPPFRGEAQPSKKALKKQQKEAEKSKRKADTAARLVGSPSLPLSELYILN